MTKNYYYEIQHILRTLERSLACTIITVSFMMLFSMRMDLKSLQVAEKNFINISVEREEISIKEQFFKDIDALALPEENIKRQQISKTDVVEETQSINEAKIETTSTYVTNYEQRDVELLARLMYAEEGIYIYKLSEDEAKYVNQLAGSVVLHRRDTHFGGAKTIEDVIFAKGQYDSVAKGTIYQEVPDIVYEWAEELLKNGPIGPENLVYQAEFEQGSDTYDQIGNQYFCIK